MNLEEKLRRTVQSGNCNGCGACSIVEPSIVFTRNDSGYRRPILASDVSTSVEQVEMFEQVCPARTVQAIPQGPQSIGQNLGGAHGFWFAYSTDEEVRQKGSSGGALSAIQLYLLSLKGGSIVASVKSEALDPRLTQPAQNSTREEVLEAAGSRYAPSSTLVGKNLLSAGTTASITAKPCEIDALRQYSNVTSTELPILLSFFCAGIPSQNATDTLVSDLLGDDELESLSYRGNGWPGRFSAVSLSGDTKSLSYEDSWGMHLGKTVEWRCKICPDGVGDGADLVAADCWEATADGWPMFEELPGRSLLIAKTVRGLEVALEAEKAGFIVLSKADIGSIDSVQRYQVERRKTLPGRLMGSVLKGKPVPRYRGFHLFVTLVRNPISNLKALKGSYARR